MAQVKSKGANKIVHAFDDPDIEQGVSGGFEEFPKHIDIDGVTHLATGAEHEAALRAGEITNPI